MTAPHNPKDYRNTCEEIAAARKWNDARLAAMKPRVADAPWLVRHGKWLLSAMAALGAVIVWGALL
jgi:hypothetical protein